MVPIRRRGPADLCKPQISPLSCITSQPFSIARLMPAPYSAGEALCSYRNGPLIRSTSRRPWIDHCTWSIGLPAPPAWNAAFPTFLTGSLIAALALI